MPQDDNAHEADDGPRKITVEIYETDTPAPAADGKDQQRIRIRVLGANNTKLLQGEAYTRLAGAENLAELVFDAATEVTLRLPDGTERRLR